MITDKDSLLDTQIRELSIRASYAWTSLIFATLALSIQFLPSMGYRLPWVLIASWALFMIAGLAGGYRLLMEPHFLRVKLEIGWEQERIQKEKDTLSNELSIEQLEQGQVTGTSGAVITIDRYRELIDQDDQALKSARTYLRRREPVFQGLFQVQTYAFLAALICMATYVAVNFLGNADAAK